MTKRLLLFILLATCCIASYVADAQNEQSTDKYDGVFSYESHTYEGVTLPYRKAVLNADKAGEPILVTYLHEAPSRGTDNALQLKEAAVDSIYTYLLQSGRPAIFIVPHCPTTTGWTGQLRRVIHHLQDECASVSNVKGKYIAGCSIGANGVWCQLNFYPSYYTAAMAVAGDPSGYNAIEIATTPVLTVMGTADTVMPLVNVENFIPAVQTAGGTIRLDVEDDSDHVTTCNRAYTRERLDWLFSHSKGGTTGVASVKASQIATDSPVYDLNGRRVSHPGHGYYIENGKIVIR